MRDPGGDGRPLSAKIHAPFSFLLVIPSIVLGLVVVYAGQKGFKWQVALVLLSLGTILVLLLKSMSRGIVALLILSISMDVKFNPLYSDYYMEIHPGIPITLPGLCIIALYVLWGIRCLRERPIQVRLIPSVTIPFILLALWAGMSVLISYKPDWALYALPGVFLSVLLLIYMANFLKSDEDIRFIVRCFAVSVALTGALGLLQHFLGSSFDLQIFGGAPELLQETYAAGTVSRVSGFLGHANRVAYFLVSILPVVLLSSMWTKGVIANIALFLASALGIATLVLTFSRGGWASFFLAMLLICFLLFRRRHRLADLSRLRIRAVMLLVIGCVLVVPVAPNIAARISDDDYDSARSRVSLAETALHIISDNPWRGVGYNNYRFIVTDYVSHPGLNQYGVPEPVHNAYLIIAAELGVPAAIVFCYILGSFLWFGLRVSLSSNQISTLFAIGLVGGLSGAYFHGMFEWIALGDPQFLSVSLMGGLVIGLVKNQKNAVIVFPAGPEASG